MTLNVRVMDPSVYFVSALFRIKIQAFSKIIVFLFSIWEIGTSRRGFPPVSSSTRAVSEQPMVSMVSSRNYFNLNFIVQDVQHKKYRQMLCLALYSSLSAEEAR